MSTSTRRFIENIALAPRRKANGASSILFLAGLAMLLAVPAAALEPQDDVVLAVEGHELVIAQDALLDNDGLENLLDPDPVNVEILDDAFGRLATVDLPRGQEYRYTPPADGLTDEEIFTYRLVTSTTASPPATVTVRISPAMVPLSGRWRTLQDGAGQCPTDLGEELGWYDSVSALFHLCDLDRQTLRLERCQELPAPSGGVGETPLVGDWDGDGFDDVGLHDPSAGIVRLFDVDHANSCPGEAGALALRTTLSWPGAAARAVAGDWNDDGVDTLGFFVRDNGVFELLTANDTQALVLTQTLAPAAQGDPPETTQPVVRPILSGADQVGYHERLKHELRLLAGGVVEAFSALYSTGLVVSTAAQPVLGYWPLADDGTVLQLWVGYFDTSVVGSPNPDSIYLIIDPKPVDAADGVHRPRYVQVVVDPGASH